MGQLDRGDAACWSAAEDEYIEMDGFTHCAYPWHDDCGTAQRIPTHAT
jgi:hypothetical protein